jgi:hypothetical protein
MYMTVYNASDSGSPSATVNVNSHGVEQRRGLYIFDRK